jgi:hypothetical protein
MYDIAKAAHVFSAIRRIQPRTKKDLKNYVKVFLGIDVPDRSICPEHNSPIDYLWHAYSVDFSDSQKMTGDERRTSDEIRTTHHARRENADCIVWANRAGGKTELAAVATLLDCIFKPNCQIRILAGSGEQAGRMYQYLQQQNLPP